jgi:CheY-like chemotaxis protein
MSRILIVEDEQHLAQGLRFNLEAEGYDVSISDTGEEALKQLKAGNSAFDIHDSRKSHWTNLVSSANRRRWKGAGTARESSASACSQN